MKLLKFKIITIAILLATGFSHFNCNTPFWENCIEVGGEITTESRSMAVFTGIEMSIPANIYITQGSPQEVKITAKKGVLKQIETSLEQSVLLLKYDTCVSNPDSIKIYITTRNINKLEINGSGDISTLCPINTDNLELKINGSGDLDIEVQADTIYNQINGSGNIKLLGTSKALNININGSGDVQALNAPTGNCIIKVNGSGDCAVFVSKSLNIHVNGSGNVSYRGSPSVSTSFYGSGSVKELK
ncbi:MAG: head GIN domain-containing protein [Bacteroidota bacterium]